MKLEELNPTLLKYQLIEKTTHILSRSGCDFHALTTQEHISQVATVEECSGIRFLCPQCLNTDRQHYVTRWSHERGVPFHASPVRYRWKINGFDISTLSIHPDFENEMTLDREEVQCSWNGFVRNGEVN
jgi:hypothetical protein